MGTSAPAAPALHAHAVAVVVAVGRAVAHAVATEGSRRQPALVLIPRAGGNREEQRVMGTYSEDGAER